MNYVQEVGDRGRTRLKFAATTVAVVLAVFLIGCAGSLYTFESDIDESGSSSLATEASTRDFPLNFLVVGDWGRNGAFNQTLVAKQVRVMFQIIPFQVFVFL